MRILYISNARLPTEKAHGYQIAKMCEAFANAGNKVKLIVPLRFNAVRENVFDYYGINANFEITRLPCLDLIPLSKYIGLLGLWFQVLSFWLFLLPYILLTKNDFIYTRDRLFAPLALFKKNIVFEAHSYPKNQFLYTYFFKKLKGVAAITQKLKDLFVKNGIALDKVLVAPDAVDLNVFDLDLTIGQAREKLNLLQDKKIIGYCGRFRTMAMEKGIDDILHALTKLDNNVIFLGVGASKKDLVFYQKQAQKLGVADRVILIGRVFQKQLAVYQKACDILLMPFPYNQHYAYYMSPLKMFEYMASNRPIIASDLPSVREILNNKNAILVKPDNLNELIAGIRKALDSRDLARAISEQAFEDVQQFTWQKRAKKILKFLGF